MKIYLITTTTPTRRDEVKPGDRFHSSHGYDILVTEVQDNAPLRTDARSIGIKGHLHADPRADTRTERYPANTKVSVFLEKAYATFDETRVAAFNAVAKRLPSVPHMGTRVVNPKMEEFGPAACMIPESGGTIGPLPDEATIELKPLSVDEAFKRAGKPWKVQPASVTGGFRIWNHKHQRNEATGLTRAEVAERAVAAFNSDKEGS